MLEVSVSPQNLSVSPQNYEQGGSVQRAINWGPKAPHVQWAGGRRPPLALRRS